MRSVIAELESLVPWFHAPTRTLIFGSAVVLALAGPAPAGPPPCRTSWNQLGTAYQFRPKMDRCEGMRGERPISPTALAKCGCRSVRREEEASTCLYPPSVLHDRCLS